MSTQVLAWLFPPGPGVDDGLGLLGIGQVLPALLLLLLIQFLTGETIAAIIWPAVSIAAAAGQHLHPTIVFTCLTCKVSIALLSNIQ